MERRATLNIKKEILRRLDLTSFSQNIVKARFIRSVGTLSWNNSSTRLSILSTVLPTRANIQRRVS